MAETAKDPVFLADAEKGGLPINFVDGRETQEFFTEAYAFPEPIVEVIKKARSQ